MEEEESVSRVVVSRRLLELLVGRETGTLSTLNRRQNQEQVEEAIKVSLSFPPEVVRLIASSFDKGKPFQLEVEIKGTATSWNIKPPTELSNQPHPQIEDRTAIATGESSNQ